MLDLNEFESKAPPHLQTIASLRTSIDTWLLQAKASAHTREELSAIQQVDDGQRRLIVLPILLYRAPIRS